jgi:hypothetical protein
LTVFAETLPVFPASSLIAFFFGISFFAFVRVLLLLPAPDYPRRIAHAAPALSHARCENRTAKYRRHGRRVLQRAAVRFDFHSDPGGRPFQRYFPLFGGLSDVPAG